MIAYDWIHKVGADEYDYENYTVSQAIAIKMLNVDKSRIKYLIKAEILRTKESNYGRRIYVKDIHKLQQIGIPERYKNYKKFYMARQGVSLSPCPAN